MTHVVRWSRVGMFGLLVLIFGYSSGVNFNATGSIDGFSCASSSCHGTPTNPGNGSVSLAIDGMPSSFVPGETYSMTLRIEHDANNVVSTSGGGFQIVAVDAQAGNNTMYGTFTEGTGQLKLGNGRLTHNSRRPINTTDNSVEWDFDWTAPAAATAPVRFYYAGNAVNGANGSSGDQVYLGSSAEIALPVVFQSFTATSLPEEVLLAWTTATELNNDYFAIERSQDGTDFKEIATVLGAGTTENAQDYRYVDADAPTGTDVFYRLRQVDFDGQFSYSETVTVRLEADAKDALAVFPNPAGAGTPVTVRVANDTPVRLLDVTGREWSLPQGTNGRTQLPDGLMPGLYMLQSGTETVRLVIQ